MKAEHKTIMSILEDYLEKNPTQRFGQVLKNLYLQNFVDEKYPDQFQALLRDIYDDEDKAIISRMLKKKYDKAEPDTLKLKLSKNISKKEFKWLKRDFKKGELVYLHTGETYGCIGKNGLACTLDGNLPFFELPAGVLSIDYQDKEYGIFMTEEGAGYSELYAKEFPFNHMDLLTEIQNSKPDNDDDSDSNQLLKVTIINSAVLLQLIRINEIKPLF